MTSTEPTAADRLAPPPSKRSDAAPKKKDKEKPDGPSHPWRDNIEAITMAIIMAVMLKYFIIEAYKIPTGSMQPTLMGNKEAQIFDRILVDKLSFHFRDPERFEVCVFKYPLDQSKNFIKRLVGVGPEQLRILYGDLWNRPDEAADWQILRRPAGVQRETWLALNAGDASANPETWKALPAESGSNWTVSEREIEAAGPGSARFPASGSVYDRRFDGYPPKIRARMGQDRESGGHVVGDLRVAGEVRAEAGCTSVELRLTEGERRYVLAIPGPAAPEDARPAVRIESTLNLDGGADFDLESFELDEAWRLPAERWVRIAGQNLDDQVSLELDGETVLQVDVRFQNPNRSDVLLTVDGAGARFRDLMVYRDIYYTTERAKRTEWTIPEGHYVMLGDNTQDSSDSREWQWARFRWPGIDDRELRGNDRMRDRQVPNPLSKSGVTWFRDEWGELYHAPSSQVESLPPQVASLVPRELVTGRAVVVFWPIKWNLRLWRLRWIH